MIGAPETAVYLQSLEQASLIRSIDRHFALRIGAWSTCDTGAVMLAAAWVSHRLGLGHVCADLPRVAGKPLFHDSSLAHPSMPPLDRWREALLASTVVGQPDDDRPLILDPNGRLYLHRYFAHECKVAEAIASRAEFVRGIDLRRLRQDLDRLFPDNPAAADDLRRGIAGQKQAAAIALMRRFAVISGGPGTGKTTTVTKLLALLVEHDPSLRIALAAPTGKAAARLSESIRTKKAELRAPGQISAALCDEMPEQASTLHRLLGSLGIGSVRFRHDAENPLPLDVLVIDEASMIDLPLMARLLDALPRDARLILLGDMHQLASVEAGQVFGDLCGRAAISACSRTLCGYLEKLGIPAEPPPVLDEDPRPTTDGIAVLQESFRFGKDSGIGNVARAVNTGDSKAALALLAGTEHADVAWRETTVKDLPALVAEEIAPKLRAYLEAASIQLALAAMERFRALCAVREGPFGVASVNRLIEEELARRGWLRQDERWYRGRPIMITRNDYGLRLFNGDIGLIWPDGALGGALRAQFPAGDGAVRTLLPSRLPEHETVYAMTVHKSQGSEFDQILLLLPDQPSPVVTRELIYTGLTRARDRALVCGCARTWDDAVARTVERSSGLAERLCAQTMQRKPE